MQLLRGSSSLGKTERFTNPDGSYTDGESCYQHTPFRSWCSRFMEHTLFGGDVRFVTGTVAVVDGGFDTYTLNKTYVATH